ncbi:hypothetical protein C6P45_002971 [Maudiozyma exigua]|uniref:Histone acetyltransferase n=1 Tax=Maudiozyma exigua TaxID=34358 RepID=A0A9P6VTU5_MAUEX|nr:hypothetical protein C6P45_002971 [Kazachstania exigua]
MRHLRNKSTNEDANRNPTQRLRTQSIAKNSTRKNKAYSAPRSRYPNRNALNRISPNVEHASYENTNNPADHDSPASVNENNLKAPISSDNWALPHNRSEANQLNPNVEFQYGREMNYEAKFIQYLHSIKIKYDPKKFLNFKRLISSDYVLEENKITEFPYHYTDTDPDIQEILYKTIYPKKIDYSTDKTVPTLEDRNIFKSTYARSRASKYINSNVLLNYTYDFKRSLKASPITKRSKVKAIYINGCEIKTLHSSPYPEYINNESIIFICENCLSYCSSRFTYWRHKEKCSTNDSPPGTVIYQDKSIRLFEIDGREKQRYCRNLCLLSMLFLRSKTLFYEVDPFLFYVLYAGDQLVGYFSKEKLNSTDYNLSCILTLPIFRRQGFGNLLMELSYLLSKREHKTGTPEKPLSDLGLLTYRYYWKCKMAETLAQLHNPSFNNNKLVNVSLSELSKITGMITSDVIYGLEQLDVLFTNDDKTKFMIIIKDWSYIESVNEQWKKKMVWKIKPERLLWKPLIFGPSGGVNATNSSSIDSQTNTLLKTIPTNDGSKNKDPFNEQMASIVSHLRDDFMNNRSTEAMTLSKIKQRLTSQLGNIPNQITNTNITWSPCFQQPIVPGIKSKQHVQKSNKVILLNSNISNDTNEMEDNLSEPDDEELSMVIDKINDNSEEDGDYDISEDNGDDGEKDEEDDEEIDEEPNLDTDDDDSEE